MISIQSWEPNSTRGYELGPDIILEFSEMADIDILELGDFIPLFDPSVFQANNPDLLFVNYEMTVD